MPELTQLLADESFQRWIQGKASETELKKWQSWIEEKPENHKLYNEAVALWHFSAQKTIKYSDTNAQWQTLKKQLQTNKEPVPRPATGYRYQKKKPSVGFYSAFAFVVVAILLVANYTGFFPGEQSKTTDIFQEISTEYGQKVTVTLPDETKIILNANSTLKYSPVWEKDSTNLFVLNGEAYFDVTPVRNPKHKFIIRTNDGDVLVVGTEFSVYKRGEGTRVVVAEGKVEVQVSDTSKFNPVSTAKTFLKPKDMLNFKKGNTKLTPQKVEVEPFTTWWKNQIVFSNTPFKEIVRRIEETYGVEVKISDKNLLKRTLSGSIENYNLVVVTDALAQALTVPVHREGNIIHFGVKED